MEDLKAKSCRKDGSNHQAGRISLVAVAFPVFRLFPIAFQWVPLVSLCFQWFRSASSDLVVSQGFLYWGPRLYHVQNGSNPGHATGVGWLIPLRFLLFFV